MNQPKLLKVLGILFTFGLISLLAFNAQAETTGKIELDYGVFYGAKGAATRLYWKTQNKLKREVPFHWITYSDLTEMTPSILLQPSQNMTAETAQELVDYISNLKIANADKQYIGGHDRLENFLRNRFEEMALKIDLDSSSPFQFQKNFDIALKLLRSYDESHRTNYAVQAGFNYIDLYGNRNGPIQHDTYFRDTSILKKAGQIYLAAVNSSDPEALAMLLNKIADLDLGDQKEFLMLYAERRILTAGAVLQSSGTSLSMISAVAELLQTGRYAAPSVEVMSKLFKASADLRQLQKEKDSSYEAFITTQQDQILKSAISYFQKVNEPFLSNWFSKISKERIPVIDTAAQKQASSLRWFIANPLDALLANQRMESKYSDLKESFLPDVSNRTELVTRQINGVATKVISIRYSGNVEALYPYINHLLTVVNISEYPVLIEGLDVKRLEEVVRQNKNFEMFQYGFENKNLLIQNPKLVKATVLRCSALFGP